MSDTNGVGIQVSDMEKKMITRFAPERVRTFDRFNRMMEEMLGNTNGLTISQPWSPVVDIKENEKEITFLFELPGMTESDIDVEIVSGILTVSGKREMNTEERKEDYVRIERSYGTFQRSFSLEGVKDTEVDATFKDGVLTVHVPKVSTPSPLKVPVKSA